MGVMLELVYLFLFLSFYDCFKTGDKSDEMLIITSRSDDVLCIHVYVSRLSKEQIGCNHR